MKKIFNKLVRDKLIDIYEQDLKEGKILDYKTRILAQDEMRSLLLDKLTEEVGEVREEYNNPEKLKEEIADVLEVIEAMMHQHGFSQEEIIQIKEKKKSQRGGFEKGVYLETIDFN